MIESIKNRIDVNLSIFFVGNYSSVNENNKGQTNSLNYRIIVKKRRI